MPGHYALVMKGADDAQLKNTDDDSTGVIFFQGRDLGTTIDSILRKKSQHFGSLTLRFIAAFIMRAPKRAAHMDGVLIRSNLV
jgi:hypothetical protein